MSVTVTLGKQGRLVVPAELRTELGLGEGDVLHVQRVGRRIVLERPVDALREQMKKLRLNGCVPLNEPALLR